MHELIETTGKVMSASLRMQLGAIPRARFHADSSALWPRQRNNNWTLYHHCRALKTQNKLLLTPLTFKLVKFLHAIVKGF